MVTLSFNVLSKVVVNQPLSSLNTFIDLLSLILIYFIVFSSWLGHYRSITHWPYTTGQFGIGRFITSIFIVFIYYYTFNIFNDSISDRRDEFFMFSFPIIFGAYLLYDSIKNREYSDISRREKKDLSYRLAITLVFLIIFIILAILFYLITDEKFFEYSSVVDSEVWKIVFLILLGLTIFAYRYKKRAFKSGQRFTM